MNEGTVAVSQDCCKNAVTMDKISFSESMLKEKAHSCSSITEPVKNVTSDILSKPKVQQTLKDSFNNMKKTVKSTYSKKPNDNLQTSTSTISHAVTSACKELTDALNNHEFVAINYPEENPVSSNTSVVNDQVLQTLLTNNKQIYRCNVGPITVIGGIDVYNWYTKRLPYLTQTLQRNSKVDLNSTLKNNTLQKRRNRDMLDFEEGIQPTKKVCVNNNYPKSLSESGDTDNVCEIIDITDDENTLQHLSESGDSDNNKVCEIIDIIDDENTNDFTEGNQMEGSTVLSTSPIIRVENHENVDTTRTPDLYIYDTPRKPLESPIPAADVSQNESNNSYCFKTIEFVNGEPYKLIQLSKDTVQKLRVVLPIDIQDSINIDTINVNKRFEELSRLDKIEISEEQEGFIL